MSHTKNMVFLSALIVALMIPVFSHVDGASTQQLVLQAVSVASDWRVVG